MIYLERLAGGTAEAEGGAPGGDGAHDSEAPPPEAQPEYAKLRQLVRWLAGAPPVEPQQPAAACLREPPFLPQPFATRWPAAPHRPHAIPAAPYAGVAAAC